MSFFLLFYSAGAVASILVAAFVYWISVKKQRSISKVMLGGLIGASLYMLPAQLLKYYSVHFYTDFAAWGEILSNITKSGIPISSIQGFLSGQESNYHWFAAHFTPLIYVLAVPYFFFPHSETIIILNVFLMISSAFPLYKIAMCTQRGKTFGVFVVAMFLWYPTFQYTTLYEFEMLRFSIPVLLWMLYAWERKRIGWYYVLVLLATLVREEVGLTVGMFGVYLLLFECRRRHGIATALLGFGAFAVITQLVMPMFVLREREFALIAAGAFGVPGASMIGVVMYLLRHPVSTLTAMVHPAKIANFSMLLVPLFGIPLLAPSVLIAGVAPIVIGLLSGAIEHSSYMLYYVSPAVPFLFYALIKAWPRFIAWLARQRFVLQNVGGPARRTLLCDDGAVMTSAAMVAMLSGLLVTSIFFGPSPIALQFWSDRFRPAPFRTQDFHWSAYVVTNHHRAVADIVERIPDDAIVSTQEFLYPRLFAKRGAMKYPQLVSRDGRIAAEYVLLDLTNNGLNPASPAYVHAEELRVVRNNAATWERIAEGDGYELYRRR